MSRNLPASTSQGSPFVKELQAHDKATPIYKQSRKFVDSSYQDIWTIFKFKWGEAEDNRRILIDSADEKGIQDINIDENDDNNYLEDDSKLLNVLG